MAGGDAAFRRKFADIPQDGLFDMTPNHDGESTRKAPKPKAVDRQKCPVCAKENVPVYRVLDETFKPHFILGDHNRATRRHSWPCKGSGKEI